MKPHQLNINSFIITIVLHSKTTSPGLCYKKLLSFSFLRVNRNYKTTFYICICLGSKLFLLMHKEIFLEYSFIKRLMILIEFLPYLFFENNSMYFQNKTFILLPFFSLFHLKKINLEIATLSFKQILLNLSCISVSKYIKYFVLDQR